MLLLALSVFILGLFLLRLIDRSTLEARGIYAAGYDSLASAQVYLTAAPGAQIKTAFATVPIEPPETMPMAGYAPRSTYDSIHDPVAIRVMYFAQPGIEVYVISADLLIFPPILRDMLLEEAQHSGRKYYFSATHTHSSLGGWDPSLAGRIAAGSYHLDYWSGIGSQLIQQINALPDAALPTRISYFEASVPIVRNRLSPGAPVDDTVRGIKLVRAHADSAHADSALLVTYSGHPTLISRKKRIISADYPGQLTAILHDTGYTFSMFAAGMMGSHSITGIEGENFSRAALTARRLADAIARAPAVPVAGDLKYLTYALPMPEPQMRVSRHLALRKWLYLAAFDNFEGHLTAFQLGPLIWVSTPCDFSGELWATGHIRVPENNQLIITSFNGDYAGYVTEDAHYDERSHAEVRTMNWVGPYFGKFTSDLISACAAKISRY